MINKLCFYIALINYNVFYSKTKGLKLHFWMSQGKTRYQFEQNDPLFGSAGWVLFGFVSLVLLGLVGLVWFCLIWFGLVWFGWFGLVWFGLVGLCLV